MDIPQSSSICIYIEDRACWGMGEQILWTPGPPWWAVRPPLPLAWKPGEGVPQQSIYVSAVKPSAVTLWPLPDDVTEPLHVYETHNLKCTRI